MSPDNSDAVLGPEWSGEAGATPEEIDDLRRRFDLSFPESFTALLRSSNGGEGELALWPGWFVLDSTHDMTSENEESFTSGEMTGIFVFGGNGGLEHIAFDTRNGQPWPVVAFDPVAGITSLQTVAPTFAAFLQAVGYPAAEDDERMSPN
jgi:hypothetical protein